MRYLALTFGLALLALGAAHLGSCGAEKTCQFIEYPRDGSVDGFVPWWQLDGGRSDAACPVPNECGGCNVLPILPGEPCGICDGEYACDGPESVRCADPCMDIIGCSDGEREAFIDTDLYPDIAACSGGWSEKGILNKSPVCEWISGDDSINPDGNGCSAADLCAFGWEICSSPAAFAAASPDVGCDATDFPDNTFYAAAVSGDGDEECDTSNTNDLFGCGNRGLSTQASCAPLSRCSGDECEDIPGEWDCPGSWLIGSSTEAEDVRKNGPAGGGVLCCRVQD